MSNTTIAELESGRNSGSSRIAYIAEALGVNPLWLTDGIGAIEVSFENTLSFEVDKRRVLIKQYDISELKLYDQSGFINELVVTEDWVRLNLKTYTDLSNLKIVTGFDDSMLGMFNNGDPLIVDVGITTIDSDAPYFFRVGKVGFIKRLQRVPGVGLRAISSNKEYET